MLWARSPGLLASQAALFDATPSPFGQTRRIHPEIQNAPDSRWFKGYIDNCWLLCYTNLVGSAKEGARISALPLIPLTTRSS